MELGIISLSDLAADPDNGDQHQQRPGLPMASSLAARRYVTQRTARRD